MPIQRAPSGRGQRGDTVAAKGDFVARVEGLEGPPVEADQAGFGAEPEIAVDGLSDGLDGVLGESVAVLPL